MSITAIQWDFKNAREESRDPTWLNQPWNMRGRILYANGQRPRFKLGDGSFCDPDPLDFFSYQVLARDDHHLIGCCRVVPLRAVQKTTVETYLGSEQFGRVVQATGVSREFIGEVERWTVLPERAGLYLGPRLIAGIWAVARALDLKRVIALAGTRNGQTRALLRTGAQLIDWFLPMHSVAYDDELMAVYANLHKPAPHFERLIDEMARHLNVGILSSLKVTHDSSR